MLANFSTSAYDNPQLFLERLRATLPDSHRQALDIVLAQPQPVFLVGGIVRDFLLGRENFDLDFVTLTPAFNFVQQVLPEFEKQFGSGLNLQEHEPFGTVRLDATADLHIDFATARQESYPEPAVLPVVIYPVSLEEDLRRRDFTINSIAFAPQRGLYDPYGGLNDLREGWLRVLHPASFRDDPTRMVRGVRFAARLGYRFDSATEQLLIEGLEAGYFNLLTPQRRRNELRLILKEARSHKALKLLQEYGLLQAIHPLLQWRKEISALFESYTTENTKPPIYVWLALLLHALGSNIAKKILDDLRFFGQEAAIPAEVAQLWEKIHPVLTPELLNSQLYALLHKYQLEAISIFGWLLQMRDSEKLPLLQRYLAISDLAPELNGDDLQRLGIPRGPRIGKLLTELRNAVLNLEIKGRQQEEEFIKNKI